MYIIFCIAIKLCSRATVKALLFVVLDDLNEDTQNTKELLWGL
jgi:hypothetical protein